MKSDSKSARAADLATSQPSVAEVMTTRPVVATESTPYKELARLMRERSISDVPIVDDAGRLVGIVSEADLLPKLREAGGEGAEPAGDDRRIEAVDARNLMTYPVVTISGPESVARAARLMEERGVRHLVVVDAEGRPQGVVSRSDLVRVYLRPDSEIRHRILFGVADEMLSIDPARLDVQVTDGVVTLAGPVADAASARLMEELSLRVAGVVGVRSSLTWPEAESQRSGWPYEPAPDVDEG